jgi:hypothetical protein
MLRSIEIEICSFPLRNKFTVLSNILLLNILGIVMAQLVETLRYKPEGRGIDSRWC